MTLKEFYAACGGDYEDTVARLYSEAFVKRFLGKFAADKNYETLKQAMETKDAQAAFMASHTLKGIALNLGITPLQRASSELCERLRGGWHDDASALFPPVEAAYTRTLDALSLLD